MHDDTRRLIRARIVLPITAPPLEDGAVLVSGARVEAVGRWAELRARADGAVVQDLGDTVLFPGFVNLHCHLDYTGFAGMMPPPRSFTEWIQGVLALKAQWSFTDYASSWITGAHQLLVSGCTTVLDFESVPELLPDVWSGTPLRVVSALELTGVRSERDTGTLVGEALARVDALPPHPRSSAVLAPHAPYSTRVDLPRACAELARQRGWTVSMHVAESAEEYAMFHRGEGRMHAWLQSQRDMSDCGRGTPVDAVARTGLLGPNAVIVHANYLDDSDIAQLAATGASVVHCPRSHDYFRHAPFPLARLLRAGVRVALGTDSLLTVRKSGRSRPCLDFFAELSSAAEAFPELPTVRLLAMGTIEGARALGRGDRAGHLGPGAEADLAAVPYSGALAEAPDFVVRRSGPVSAVMIGGTWVLGDAVPVADDREAGRPAP